MKKIFFIVFGCFPLLMHSQNEYNINTEQQIINYSTGNLPGNANNQIVQYNQQKVQNPVAYRQFRTGNPAAINSHQQLVSSSSGISNNYMTGSTSTKKVQKNRKKSHHNKALLKLFDRKFKTVKHYGKKKRFKKCMQF